MDVEEDRKALWDATLRRIEAPPVERRAFAPATDPKLRLMLVLIEFREHAWMAPVLHNAAHVYGGRPDVGLTVVCGRANQAFVQRIVAGWADVVLQVLPIDNADIPTYNALLTSAGFWRMFLPCPTVLVFQTDTLTRRAVPDEYLDRFSYVGAPWAGPQICGPRHGVVGNGGYSLREVAAMIRACERNAYDPDADRAEDLFFAKHGTGERRCIAPADAARAFSVEHVPHPDPCGMHQAWRFHPRALVARWLDGLPGLPRRAEQAGHDEEKKPQEQKHHPSIGRAKDGKAWL